MNICNPFPRPCVHDILCETPCGAPSAGKEVVIETLSHSPRVFSLANFMDPAEADQIIEDALSTTHEDYRLKVSPEVV